MKFIEDAEVARTRETRDGYLVAVVKCARTGIQIYSGDELGRPDLGIVRVYRPEEEVFSNDSVESFVGKPCTDNHPPEPVTADNWKQYAAGSIGEGFLRAGEFAEVPITLMDKDLVDKVKAGKRELSMGYTMNLDWTPGTAPDGQAYDAVQRDIRINHLAVVDRGRAGKDCRVGDGEKWATAPSPDNTPITDTMSDKLQTVVVDGIPVSTTEAGAATINKLTKDKETLQAKVDASVSDHTKAIEDKDKELAAKDAEIETLKKSQIDDAAIDQRVEARAKLIGDASKLAKDADFSGKSETEIKRAAVEAVRGADSMKDKSDAYVEAAYDIALDAAKEGAGGDEKFRKAVETRDHNANDDNGQDKWEQDTQDAWKGEAA